MNSQDFCYWLQGFSELTEAPPSQEQWDAIKSHLALVFQKVTPPVKYPGIGDLGRAVPNHFGPVQVTC